MSTHPFSRTATSICQTLTRYRWPIALGLLSVVAALVATLVANVSQMSDTNQAQQNTLGYVRTYQATAEALPRDPAQQGVLDYLRAHAPFERVIAIDPAAQSVNDYLRAHTVAATRLQAPAQQGVLDYLRAHQAVTEPRPRVPGQ